MGDGQRTYIAIDLKSFYASVECVERNLDPLTTNLVVADLSRTEKTICLAVSPSLKAYGIPGRARLFKVAERLKEVNAARRKKAPGETFSGASCLDEELKRHPELEASYLVAPPRMALYMEYSTRIYQIYLNYVAPEDIHVYSIDEVFMDVTHYLSARQMTARQFAAEMAKDVQRQTGITAAAGIGTNLYLCKVAMDIVAKHAKPDKYGVRIATLNEISYRRVLWNHRPLTDFWRVGHGYRKKLEEAGIYTMGDIARCSIGGPRDYFNEDLLYQMFGVNAELLIDHAWGYEPVTIDLIKAYQPQSSSVSSGQVLHCPYDFARAKVVVREMADALALDLVEKRMVADQMTLTVGYDNESLADPDVRTRYRGAVTEDHYGRKTPKHAHGTINLGRKTSSARLIVDAVTKLYEDIVNPDLLVRRMNVAANHVSGEPAVKEAESFEQMNLFTDYEALAREREKENTRLAKERKLQETMLAVKKKYGKNAVLKGMNLREGATGMERNRQIGGHKA